MRQACFEKVDVFLPGQGESLTQAPAYRWERMQDVVGHFYLSTSEPYEVLVNVKGMSEELRARFAPAKTTVDYGSLKFHEFNGFGTHEPGLIVTQNNTAIAACQKRYGSMADVGYQVDILIARSSDGGRSWERQETLFREKDVNTFLGPVFEDRLSGTVFVAFWKMPSDELDHGDYFDDYGKRGGGFWLLKSDDDGQSWSEPFFVKPEPNEDDWVSWSNNCVHGIQLELGPCKGRLVIPAFLYKQGEKGWCPGVRSGLLYSDDQARSWRTGAVLPEGSDEVSLVETIAGDIYVSHRMNTRQTGKRHFARSADGGATFCEFGQHEELFDPGIHAGLVRYSSEDGGGENVLLFSNPAVDNNMTIHTSLDEGRTWRVGRVLERGPCRYSDLAVSNDGSILCLYTNGKIRDREKISVARFNLEWLED